MVRNWQGKSGSSPRWRGTWRDLGLDAPHAGFIPACAGNIGPLGAGSALRFGSSPWPRGTATRRRSNAAFPGFIPARGGNTPQPGHPTRRIDGSSPRAGTAWRALCGKNTVVHPRVGGEHGGISACTPPHAGSSPRARGTWLGAVQSDARVVRFIPARAGNTRGPVTCPPSRKDPRTGSGVLRSRLVWRGFIIAVSALGGSANSSSCE